MVLPIEEMNDDEHLHDRAKTFPVVYLNLRNYLLGVGSIRHWLNEPLLQLHGILKLRGGHRVDVRVGKKPQVSSGHMTRT